MTQETNNTSFQVTPELLARGLETPRLNMSPLPEYGYDRERGAYGQSGPGEILLSVFRKKEIL